MKPSEEILLLQARTKHVKKWKEEIKEEFQEYEAFYTIEWFLEQMKLMDALLKRLEVKEIEAYKEFNKLKSTENSIL